jgi:hypothetical protein
MSSTDLPKGNDPPNDTSLPSGSQHSTTNVATTAAFAVATTAPSIVDNNIVDNNNSHAQLSTNRFAALDSDDNLLDPSFVEQPEQIVTNPFPSAITDHQPNNNPFSFTTTNQALPFNHPNKTHPVDTPANLTQLTDHSTTLTPFTSPSTLPNPTNTATTPATTLILTTRINTNQPFNTPTSTSQPSPFTTLTRNNNHQFSHPFATRPLTPSDFTTTQPPFTLPSATSPNHPPNTTNQPPFTLPFATTNHQPTTNNQTPSNPPFPTPNHPPHTNNHTTFPTGLPPIDEQSIVNHILQLTTASNQPTIARPGEFIHKLQALLDANTDLPTIQQSLIEWIVETSTHATEVNRKKNE